MPCIFCDHSLLLATKMETGGEKKKKKEAVIARKTPHVPLYLLLQTSFHSHKYF